MLQNQKVSNFFRFCFDIKVYQYKVLKREILGNMSDPQETTPEAEQNGLEGLNAARILAQTEKLTSELKDQFEKCNEAQMQKQGENEQLRQEVKRLEIENSILSQRNEQLISENEEIIELLRNQTENNLKYKQLEHQKAELCHCIEKLQGQKDQLQKFKQFLQKKLIAEECQNQSLRVLSAQRLRQTQILKERNQELSLYASNLKLQIQQQSIKFQVLSITPEENLEDQIIKLKEIIQEKSWELQEVQGELEQAKDEVKQAKEEAQQKVKKLKRDYEEKNVWKDHQLQQLDSLRKIISDFQLDLSTQAKCYQKQINKQQIQIKSLQIQINKHKQHSKLLQDQKNNLSIDLQNARIQRNQVHIKLKNLQKESSELRNLYQNLNKQLQEGKYSIIKSQNQINSLNEQKQLIKKEITTLQQENENLAGFVEQKQKEITTLQQENENLAGSVEQKQEEIATLQRENKNLTVTVKQKQQELKKLESIVENTKNTSESRFHQLKSLSQKQFKELTQKICTYEKPTSNKQRFELIKKWFRSAHFPVDDKAKFMNWTQQFFEQFAYSYVSYDEESIDFLNCVQLE